MIEDPDLLAFAVDARALVAIGPDEERIDLGRATVTFSPGGHYWSTEVARVRFGDDVPSELDAVHDQIRARGRSAAAWTVGGSATPSDVVPRLLASGLESEPGDGSLAMVLTDRPRSRTSPFRVVVVSTFEEHLASIEVANEGFDHPADDAEDELRRARQSFEAERAGGHTARLLAFEGDRPVATGRAWFGPKGLYLGGGATISSHRRRGAMTSLVATAWDEAARRGLPALVAYSNAMSAPVLESLGFRAVGRVRHLIDRFD